MAKFVSSLPSMLTGISVYDGFKIAVLMLFEIWWSQLHAELYVDTHMSSIQPSIHPVTHTCTRTCTHTYTHTQAEIKFIFKICKNKTCKLKVLREFILTL